MNYIELLIQGAESVEVPSPLNQIFSSLKNLLPSILQRQQNTTALRFILQILRERRVSGEKVVHLGKLLGEWIILSIFVHMNRWENFIRAGNMDSLRVNLSEIIRHFWSSIITKFPGITSP